MEEKTPTHNQKILQERAARTSVHDWGQNLGDERLRMSRVMIAKLIRAGNEDILDILAEYLGVRLIREDTVDAEWERQKGLYPERKITREMVRKHLESK